jgi:hypothetical protein
VKPDDAVVVVMPLFGGPCTMGVAVTTADVSEPEAEV